MTDETGTSLKPAATNPWYVLMTVAGEQTGADLEGKDRLLGYDSALHARNRRYWNGWVAQALDEAAKEKLLADGRATEADLAPLTEEERQAIDEALASRCPGAERPEPAAGCGVRRRHGR